MKPFRFLCTVIAACLMMGRATSPTLSVPRTLPSDLMQLCPALPVPGDNTMGEVVNAYAKTVQQYGECGQRVRGWVTWAQQDRGTN